MVMTHGKLLALALALAAAAATLPGCKREPAPAGAGSSAPAGSSAAVSPSASAAAGGSAAPAGSSAAPGAPAAGADPVARGEQAVGALKRQLVGALTAALQSGPPAAAIAVCSGVAPGVAQTLSAGGVTVGRATRKPRNPANAAAGWRADALAHFEARVAAGRPLAGTSWSAQLPGGATAYAEPLVIQPLCLACHGVELSPEVRAELASRYPADQATGYAAGDLRGIAWAEIAAAPAAP